MKACLNFWCVCVCVYEGVPEFLVCVCMKACLNFWCVCVYEGVPEFLVCVCVCV